MVKDKQKPKSILSNPRLVKDKKRVADHGEVFTSQREVDAMLDMVKHETERIDSRFLEPACGNGNFLAEVLERKLKVVTNSYRKTQLSFERFALLALTSIYGVDILEDNVEECRGRLLDIFKNHYFKLFGNKHKPECLISAHYILQKNILVGNALDFTNPTTKEPIVFTEWSAVNGSLLKRREYVFRFLVEKTHQFSMFNDEGQPAAIDEPVKDYPLIHFLKLGQDDNN